MTDAAQLMADVEADALALDGASKELQEVTDRFANVKMRFQDALDQALVEVEDEYRKRDEKLPSERQREAHARPRVEAGIRREFVELEERVKLIQKWSEIRGRALSARQSLLKAEGQTP